MKFFRWLNVFGFLISKFADTREVYNNLKNDPEERGVTTYMGKRALVWLLIFALFFIGGPSLSIWCASSFISTSPLWGVILLITGIVAALYALILIPIILNYIIKQLVLNKRAIGWIALILFLIIIGLGIGAFVIIAGL